LLKEMSKGEDAVEELSKVDTDFNHLHNLCYYLLEEISSLLVDSGISPHLLANSTKLTSRVDFFRK
jgi:hypothetical protein